MEREQGVERGMKEMKKGKVKKKSREKEAATMAIMHERKRRRGWEFHIVTKNFISIA